MYKNCKESVMTNKSSSMTMKSDNDSKLVNTNNNNNNNTIYYNSSSNKSATSATLVPTATLQHSSSSSSGTVTATTSDLPSITLAPFSKIKRESESSDPPHGRPTPSSMVTKSLGGNNNSSSSSSAAAAATSAAAANSVSAKMGSRRIFTPQFKLQVLESYRNDSDCKGNQRATARKYNIHRRQIQKWLQCESNLRSSVANISANNVKHQFHNITHQMPIVTTSTLPSSASSSSSIHTNSNHHHHHNHHAHHNQQYKAINNRLSLDTTRHSVALTSIPIPTSKASQGVLAAAVAAAAAAAAANVGDVGAVAPLSSPSPASTSYLSTTVKSLHAATSPILHHPQILTKSTVSPSALQCTTKGGSAAAAAAAPSMLHTPYHHHHHDAGMGIHTPPALLTSVPVPVSIITPHPHTHLHVANLKSHYHHLHMESQQQQQQQQQQHHHHHHHHLHHHPYSQMPQPPPPPQQSSERRPFMSSACLPALPTSSSSSSSHSSSSSSSSASSMASSPPAPMTAVALSCTDTPATTPAVAPSLVQAEENRIDELRDYQTTTATTTVVAENRYMNENEYAHSRTQHRTFEGFHYYMSPHMHPALIAPIDLSLGTKRLGYALSFGENNNEYKRERGNGSSTTFIDTPKREPSPKENEHDDADADADVDDDNDDSHLNVVDSDFSESSVVDLTLRKRKVLMPTAASEPETVSAEKHTKLSPDADHDEKDVGDKPQEPAKTFKLFKPYLLDDDNGGDKVGDGDKETANKICKQKDPIIWSHHTACLSPPISHDSRQCSSRGSNFQSPPADAYPFPAGSPNFQPTTAAATPSSFRCPKGSPVSGYESSSSIYSDSASSSGDHHYISLPPATYSLDLKVHNINGGDLLLPHKHLISAAANRAFIGDTCIPHVSHVQRWLDQEHSLYV